LPLTCHVNKCKEYSLFPTSLGTVPLSLKTLGIKKFPSTLSLFFTMSVWWLAGPVRFRPMTMVQDCTIEGVRGFHQLFHPQAILFETNPTAKLDDENVEIKKPRQSRIFIRSSLSISERIVSLAWKNCGRIRGSPFPSLVHASPFSRK